MSERIPTTEEVEAAFACAKLPAEYREEDAAKVTAARKEFDAWMTAHDAEVAARALEEAAKELYISSEGPAYYLDVALAETKAADFLRNLAAQKRGA